MRRWRGSRGLLLTSGKSEDAKERQGQKDILSSHGPPPSLLEEPANPCGIQTQCILGRTLPSQRHGDAENRISNCKWQFQMAHKTACHLPFAILFRPSLRLCGEVVNVLQK